MQLSDFLRIFQTRAQNIMWFFGAGTSASAGVPTANHLIWKFKQILYCTNQKVSVNTCRDLGDPALQIRLQKYFDDTKKYPQKNSDEEYAGFFESAYPDEADRRRIIEDSVSGASPSYGHIALASLMKMEKIRIIWTTNFDSMIEDAASIVYGSTSKIVVASPESGDIASDALNEERYPILVKLHGDFRSRRLKNTTGELRSQDATLRENLIQASKRTGMAVVGYSGRDRSVMDALEKALDEPNSFPFGIFWFVRSMDSFSPQVKKLIAKAKNNKKQAELIEFGTFDELFGDLMLIYEDIPEDIQTHLDSNKKRLGALSLPQRNGGWPVLRLNALPIISMPLTCRKVVCEIGGAREVQDTIKNSNANIVAGRRQSGVIAFGEDSEIKKAFEPFNISDFDLHTIDSYRLRFESAELGLIYDAFCKAIERERPLKTFKRRNGRIIAIDINQLNSPILAPLKKSIGEVSGLIQNGSIVWCESVRMRFDYRFDNLWIIIEPTIYLECSKGTEITDKAREFVRQRLASRYNKAWNSLLDSWSNIITAGKDNAKLCAFGIDDGCDATFTVSRTTAFSWQGK